MIIFIGQQATDSGRQTTESKEWTAEGGQRTCILVYLFTCLLVNYQHT